MKLQSKATVRRDQLFWDTLEVLEGQHWVSRSFKGRGELEFSGSLRFAGQWNGSIVARAREEEAIDAAPRNHSESDANESAPAAANVSANAVSRASHLYVLKGARILGRLIAQRVTVEGSLDDIDVEAEHFHALAGSRVVGRVKAKTVVIEEGALVQGRIISEATTSAKRGLHSTHSAGKLNPKTLGSSRE